VLLLPMINSPLYEQSNQYRLGANSIFNAHDYSIMVNVLREQAGNTLLDRVLFNRYWLMARELLFNYSDNLSLNFLFVTGDPNLRHGTGSHGVLLLPTLPLMVMGIYWLARKQLGVLMALLAWWMAALLPASVPETTPHALRSLNALMPILVLCSFGGGGIYHWVGELIRDTSPKVRVMGWGTGIAYLGFLSFAFISFTYHYFTVYPKQSAYDWQDSYPQLVPLIQEQQSKVRTVVVSQSEERLYLWLLAYGPYTADEIQKAPKSGYSIKKLNNIQFNFDGYSWEKFGKLDHKILLIGQTIDIDSRLAETQLKTGETFSINSYDGTTPRFKAVIFEPQL
jgi:hypothetical protein